MNKKEKEQYEAALLQAEMLAALRWTASVEPDMPIPTEGVTYGWLFNTTSKHIYAAWSQPKLHGDMPYMPKYGFKGGIALYSTKYRALAAMRHAVEQQTALDLLNIDKQIAYEMEQLNL